SVETGLGAATTIDCVQNTPGGPCTFTLSFRPRGFAAGTRLRVLARAIPPEGPWVLGADPVASSSDASRFTALLVLAAQHGGPPEQVQFAVLAFPGTAPSAPMNFPVLVETGAEFAFVTDVLSVRVSTVCCQCPDFCAAPVAGTCGGCSVVVGAACL